MVESDEFRGADERFEIDFLDRDAAVDEVEGGVHMALVYGTIDTSSPVAVRVHVHRGLLDMVLQSHMPESWKIDTALKSIVEHGSGIIVLLAYHESADELASRIDLRNNPRGHVDHELGQSVKHQSPASLRMLGAGGQILADLGIQQILALGREKRTFGLSGFGLEIVEYIADQQSLKNWEKEHE